MARSKDIKYPPSGARGSRSLHAAPPGIPNHLLNLKMAIRGPKMAEESGKRSNPRSSNNYSFYENLKNPKCLPGVPEMVKRVLKGVYP